LAFDPGLGFGVLPNNFGAFPPNTQPGGYEKKKGDHKI
jgi:hypothetical protein